MTYSPQLPYYDGTMATGVLFSRDQLKDLMAASMLVETQSAVSMV